MYESKICRFEAYLSWLSLASQKKKGKRKWKDRKKYKKILSKIRRKSDTEKIKEIL